MVEPPAGAPPLRQAFSLTWYSSVSLTSPCLMAWNTTSAVISFIMLEGARSSSAFFSNRTLPLGGLDQDRGRRIALESALLLLGAARSGGRVDEAAPSQCPRTRQWRNQAAQEAPLGGAA